MDNEAKRYLSKYSKKERIRNWFYYYKWWILLVFLILVAALRLIWQNVTRLQPDYQIAYIGEAPLPDDTAHALESALSEFGEDLNGDNRVIFQLNQYPTASENASDDEILNQSAWETQLMADLLRNDSYFFLLSDPDKFQSSYHVLAKLDGSIPDDSDHTGLDKVYRYADCPLLASLELGDYSEIVVGQNVTGDNKSLVEHLYIGRRFFRDETDVPYLNENNALWKKLTEGAAK